MMKKLVALLMALALLCTSIGAFANELESETPQIQQGTTEQGSTEQGSTEQGSTEQGSTEQGSTEQGSNQLPSTDEPNGADKGPYGPKAPYTEGMDTPKNPTHKYGYADPAQHVDATCAAPGKDVLLCKECGTIYEEPIEQLPHTIKEGTVDRKVTTDRTCTEDGVITVTGYCTVCQDYVVTGTEPYVAKGHEWDEGVVTKEADCENNEERHYTCAVCSATKDEEVKDSRLKHTWELPDWEEKHTHAFKQVTCAENGEIGEAEICDRPGCGKINPDTIEGLRQVLAIDHAEEWEDRVTYDNEDIEEAEYGWDWIPFLKTLGATDDDLAVCDDDWDYYWLTVDLLEASDISDYVLKNAKLKVLPEVTYDLPDTEDDLDLTAVKKIDSYEISVTYNKDYEPTTGKVEETKVEYTAPTCGADGSIVLTCTECDAESFVLTLPAYGHQYVRIRNEQEGNKVTDCTKPNSAMFQCLYCGDRYSQAIEPATKHTIELDTEDFNPAELDYDDEESQIIAFIQQKEFDGEPITYKVNFEGNPTWHTWNEYVNAVVAAHANIAICRDYQIVVKCVVGFCEHTETISVAGDEEKHIPGKNYFKTEKTCIVPEIEYYNCAECGKPVTKNNGYDAHTPVTDTEHVVEPTCLEPGVRPIICSVCNAPIRTEVIPALGHHYIYTIYPANCKLDVKGKEIGICSRCGEQDPNVRTWSGHKKADDDEGIVTQPKCTEEGSITYTCTICHRDVTDPIEPKGHTYERKDAAGNLTEPHVCVFEGQGIEQKAYCEAATCKNGEAHALTHAYICGDCGHVEYETEGEVPEHSMFRTQPGDDQQTLNNFYIEKLPTCTEEGKAQYICSLCNERQEMTLAKIPHNYELTFDPETGAYKLSCVQMEATNANRNKLVEMLINQADYNELVAAAVADELNLTTGKYFKGIGNCGEEISYDVVETHFSIGRLPGTANRGYVKLDEGARNLKPGEEPYVLLTWMYHTSNGDTISITDIRSTSEVWNEELGWVFTFKVSGNGTLSDGVELECIWAEVVTNPDADEAAFGSFKIYGQGEL